MRMILMVLVVTVLFGASGVNAQRQDDDRELWKVAKAACSGSLLAHSALLEVLPLSAPVRILRDGDRFIVGIPDRECPVPSENANFIIGHEIEWGKALYYETSAQGEIINAAESRHIEGTNKVRIDKITSITPEATKDFEQLKNFLITRYGNLN